MAYSLSKPIVIVDYDPRWPDLYAAERQALVEILRPVALHIAHIGSTSVPGLAAKPIIDIAVGACARDDIAPYVDALAGIGYAEIPILAVFQRRMFSKGPYNAGSHHLHVTDAGSDTWLQPIIFRDFLRAHPDVARQYGAVKRAAALHHQNDLNGYHDEKAVFVAQVMDQAHAWYVGRR